MSAQARRSTGLAVRCGSGAAAAGQRRAQAVPVSFSLQHQLRTAQHQHQRQPCTARALQTLSSPTTLVPPFSLSVSSNCYVALADTLSARSSVLLLRPVFRGRIRSLPFIMGARDHSDHHDHDHDHDHGHGHSHGLFGHHHHHDNSYLTSADKNDPGVRITRIGLLSNLAMAIAKFIGGWAFNSKAMIADGWHSIADLASDILTLATVSWSIKPPTDRFPLGFGKVESLGALGVSGMLLVGGCYMGFESAMTLYGHWDPETAHHMLEHAHHGHSHSHSHADLGIPSIHAAWLAAATILVKEWLYQATMKVARERKSSVLASNAVHHRIDSLTGIVTLFAIIGANVIENAAWLDPVGGLLISIMVLQAGLGNSKAAFLELIDQSLDDEVKSSVRKHAQRAIANVSEGHQAELRDITGTKSGPNYLVDLEMAVPGAWTVNDVKDLEDAVRTLVGGKVRGVKRIRVRFVSRDGDVNRKFDEFIPGSARASVSEESDQEEEHNHDHDHDHDHDHKHKD
ncbi:cation efflux family domain-containing protein [Trichoderma sp. SZMC 28014]